MTEFNRYSHKPIEQYVLTHGTLRTGPWVSGFLKDDPRAWNLAFLSHPFEDMPGVPDGQFTVRVRQSLQMVVDTGEIDHRADPALCVAHFMSLPAPQAVLKLLAMKHLFVLPMYQAYGPKWIETIYNRSWLVRSPDNVEEPPIDDLSQAQALLEQIASK